MNKLPEAYEIGWVPFINTKIWLDSRPLIPRTETEYWVNEAIGAIRASDIAVPKILDLCAGSGAIGIALLKEIPGASADFAEIEEAHHATIHKNLAESGIAPQRARVFGGNLFERLTGIYDFILSNPPYIDMALGRVEESVLAHEPHLALDGGRGGMEIIEKILAEAPAHLTEGGILWLEHEPEQVTLLSSHPLYAGSYPDQFGRLRYSQFRKR